MYNLLTKTRPDIEKDYNIEVKCGKCQALLFKIENIKPPSVDLEIKCRKCGEYTYI